MHVNIEQCTLLLKVFGLCINIKNKWIVNCMPTLNNVLFQGAGFMFVSTFIMVYHLTCSLMSRIFSEFFNSPSPQNKHLRTNLLELLLNYTSFIQVHIE